MIKIDEAKTIMATHKSPVRLRKRVEVASSEDPREELRRLVMQHKALTKAAVAIKNMSSDRKSKTTGELIECRLPEDAQAAFHALIDDVASPAAGRLERAMLKQLKQIPIYQHFLSKVFGCGPVVSAYLVSEIDIQRAVKPSNLRRYCGLAVIDGHLERRSGAPKAQGGTGTFNGQLRTCLFQMFSAMWKNAAKSDASTKYLQIWRDYIHRIEQSDRVTNRGVDAKGVWTGKIVNGGGKTVSARGFAFSTGWHKAADVFVEDLYIVWRAMEGHEVWPSYYAAKLGYQHGGKICVNAPKNLTLEEALELVGDVGKAVPEVVDQAAEE